MSKNGIEMSLSLTGHLVQTSLCGPLGMSLGGLICKECESIQVYPGHALFDCTNQETTGGWTIYEVQEQPTRSFSHPSYNTTASQAEIPMACCTLPCATVGNVTRKTKN